MAKKKAINRNQILIKNIGLFWRMKDVFWGKPKVPGNLHGIRVGAKRKEFVDFREQVGIYVLYADYKIVYIGQAGNGNAKLFTRLKTHLSDDLSGRWNQFSWFGLKWVKQDNKLSGNVTALHPQINTLLNHIEAILIHSSEPPLNRQGGRWGTSVQRFLQRRDQDNLGISDSEMLKELYREKQKEREKKRKAKEKNKRKRDKLKK